MSTDIRAAQRAVEGFMSAGGQVTNVVPQVPPMEIAKRRLTMLDEEVNEWAMAVENGDLVEIAVEIADIIYVALGAAVEAGIDIEPVLEEVIGSNASKIDWQSAKPWAVHPNGKVAKDEHYEPPQIESIIERQGAF